MDSRTDRNVGNIAASGVHYVQDAVLPQSPVARPRGRCALGAAHFGTAAEAAERPAGLAVNQGLHNVLLVAGLVWA